MFKAPELHIRRLRHGQQSPNVFTVPLSSAKGFAVELKIALSDWE